MPIQQTVNSFKLSERLRAKLAGTSQTGIQQQGPQLPLLRASYTSCPSWLDMPGW